MPVVGVVGSGSGDTSTPYVTAFRKGLNEKGIIEGQNVTVEYHWLEGQYDRLPPLMDDLVRRRVAVIAIPASNPAALAAKAATTTIPIVFGVAEDPVKLGLVASLARPGGNATGVNFLFSEVVAKRLGLLHDLVPKAARIAVLVNPANASITKTMLRDMPEAAHARHQRSGHVPSGRHLYRQHPQGREARRFAGVTVDQIRIRHQPADGEGARHRGAQLDPIARRRGDRVM
jgi:putative ABC transport system substrate-binding protein